LFTIQEILDVAVKIEKNGEAVYRRAAEKINNPDLVDLLEWMADEEHQHADWFAGLKKRAATPASNPFVAEMSQALFADLLGDKNFSHKEVDFSRIDRIDDLFAVFIEFQKDTVIFYETLKPFVEDERTLEYLNKVIAEENNHIKQFRQKMGTTAELIIGGE